MQITVSIIIPHLKGKKNLSECIQSIDKKISYEIIVVDNNSLDDGINYIRKEFPEVNIIKSKYNRGYAGGCNLGAKYAKGEYLLFLNDDTILTKDSIEVLLNVFNENKQISSVQPGNTVDSYTIILFLFSNEPTVSDAEINGSKFGLLFLSTGVGTVTI